MFSPTAARALVARVRKDNRNLEKELAYQEHMQKEAPGALTVTEHGHGPPDSHGAPRHHSPESTGGACATPSPPAHTPHDD
jgi:hypothetical protein